MKNIINNKLCFSFYLLLLLLNATYAMLCYRNTFDGIMNRGGGRTILNHNRNGFPRSNSWSNDGGRLIRMSGDIILGGIFPMHEHNINNPEYPCGMVKEEKGMLMSAILIIIII